MSATVTENKKKKEFTYPYETNELIASLLVFSMIFSVTALFMKIKWMAWLALIMTVYGLGNKQNPDDVKQFLSAGIISVVAIFTSYMADLSPMKLPFV